MAAAQSGLRPPDDEDESKVNTVSKTEFFQQDFIKNNYRYVRNGKYRLKDKGSPVIEDANFLEWDHLHGHVEVYKTAKKWVGWLDPETLILKSEDITRNIGL